MSNYFVGTTLAVTAFAGGAGAGAGAFVGGPDREVGTLTKAEGLATGLAAGTVGLTTAGFAYASADNALQGVRFGGKGLLVGAGVMGAAFLGYNLTD